MSSPRKKHRVLNAFFLIFVILITLWLVVSSAYLVLRTLAQKEQKLPSLFGYQISVEMTGRMEEIVPNGSVVLVEEKPNPSVGDIILYQTSEDENPVSGRIKEILSFDNEPEYAVSFDAETGTIVNVYRSSVYGQVMYTIPFLGHVVNYLNSFNGILFAVLVPGIFLIALLVIRMILSIRASRKAENDEDGEEDAFTVSSIPIERESNAELAYRNEELDAIWKSRQAGLSETEDIATDQDMVQQLSNLNNSFAADSAAVQKQEETRKAEAEKIVSEISGQSAPIVKSKPEALQSPAVVKPEEEKNFDYSQLISTLGLESKESSDLISMLRQYGVTDKDTVESVQKAAPFIRPVVTDHSVDLDLEDRSIKKIRVVSDEYGKFLIIESDQVETKIRLPF